MIGLDVDCLRCGTAYPTITVCSAAHDTKLIDIVVACAHCGYTLNAFVSLDEMTEVPSSHEETPHD